jgi:putative YhbY family RNA-binding protein
MAVTLSARDRSRLKARAHALEPTVTIGQDGLTDAVLREIERALAAHELIKVRGSGGDRVERRQVLHTICERTDAAPVQQIGRIFVIWRPRAEPPDRVSSRA